MIFTNNNIVQLEYLEFKILAATNPPIVPKIGFTIKLFIKIEIEYKGENPFVRMEFTTDFITVNTSFFTSSEKGRE